MKTLLVFVAFASALCTPALCQDVTFRYVAPTPLSGLYITVQNSSDYPIVLGYQGTDWYLDDTGVGYKICLDPTISWCLSGKPNNAVELDDDPDNWTVWTWRVQNSTNIIPIDWVGSYQSNFTAPYLDIDLDTVVIKNDGDYSYGWEITSPT